MRPINSYSDLRRYVSDQVDNIHDKSMYINENELIGVVTHDLLEMIVDDYEFEYGQEMPDITDWAFWNLFEPYEVCNERT